MRIDRKFLPWVFAGLGCFLLLPNLVYGVREAHDIKFHLTLFLSYRDAVELGTLYPRWLPDQLQGLGSPALMIYPPLASAFFVLVDFLTVHALAPERVLGLGVLLLSMASAVTFYLWAREYASARLAMIAALFYATAPYHLNLDLYARGALAEYTAFVWIPLIFLGIRTTILRRDARGPALLAIGAAALFLTHLLTAMMVAPLALAYALVCLRTELPPGLRIQRFVLVTVTSILGVGLAAFYYLPAMSLLGEANSGGLSNDVTATNLFFLLRTLSDRFQIKLLLIGCTYLSFFLYLFAETWSNWRKQRVPNPAIALALLWIVAGVLSFALMGGLFPFIFRPPSPYAQMQFLWRLLMLMEFSLVSLFVCCVAGTHDTTSRARLLKVGTIGLLMMGASQCLDVVARFHNVAVFSTPIQELDQVKRRLVPIEYFPAGTKVGPRVDVAIRPFEQYANASAAAFIASDTGKLVDVTRKGAKFTVHSSATAPIRIMIQQFYFPGWKAFEEHGKEIVVFRDEASGLASYIVPAGEHIVEVERLPTRQEHFGNIISLTALALLALLLGFLFWCRQTRQLPHQQVERFSATPVP